MRFIPKSDPTLSRFEQFWLIPIASLFVLLAEYSRYLTWSRAGAYIFNPKVFAAVGLLTIGVWVIAVLRNQKRRAASGHWKLIVIPLALLTWILLSLLWSEYATSTPAALEWLNGFILVLLVGLAARPIWGSKIVATSLVVSVCAVVAIGLIEKITDTHLPLSNLHNPYRQQWAITSVFIGQNHLAASLALLLPLVAGFGLAWRGWRRWLSLVSLGGGLVALFFTGSTLGLAAVGVAGAIFWLLAVIRAKAKMRGRLFFAALFIVLGIVAAWTLLPAGLKERVSAASLGARQSFDARVVLVREGFALIGQHPLRGLGPGATSELVEVTVGNQPTLRALHNLTLEFTVTFGAIAVSIVAGWLIVLVVRVVRRLPGKGQRWPSIGILASLGALTVVQAVPSTFEGVRAPFIAIGLALALAMRPQLAQQKTVAAQS